MNAYAFPIIDPLSWPKDPGISKHHEEPPEPPMQPKMRLDCEYGLVKAAA